MNKLRLFFLLLVFSTANSFAQNISGLWTGRFTSFSILQNELPYKYELLIFQNGDNLSGYSYSSAGSEDFYAVCEIEGKLFDGYMVINEKSTIYQNPSEPEGSRQSHILFLSSENKEATGDWKQINKRTFQMMPMAEGKTFLKREDDPSNSSLIKILQRKKVIAVDDKKNQPKNTDSVKLASREKEILQTILISSDSVQIELYDDGMIDGDSVSVFINNAIFINKAALTDKALKRTIHLPATKEPIIISMFAENEGSIPPNTGLLIIKDEQKKYEIRFKSDLKKSSAVELKRSN